MRIVIDTNVIASAVFFGGRPGELLEMILRHQVEAVATAPFLAEYQATIHYLLERYGGEHLRFSIMPIFAAMEVIPQTDSIHVCRDPDDDKFISCAVDCRYGFPARTYRSNCRYRPHGTPACCCIKKIIHIAEGGHIP